MYSENQIQSLRKLYHKTLWTHVGVATLLVAAAIFLAYSPLFTDDSLIPWLIAGGIGLALSAAEYAIERALYKKGKKALERCEDYSCDYCTSTKIITEPIDPARNKASRRVYVPVLSHRTGLSVDPPPDPRHKSSP